MTQQVELYYSVVFLFLAITHRNSHAYNCVYKLIIIDQGRLFFHSIFENFHFQGTEYSYFIQINFYFRFSYIFINQNKKKNVIQVKTTANTPNADEKTQSWLAMKLERHLI